MSNVDKFIQIFSLKFDYDDNICNVNKYEPIQIKKFHYLKYFNLYLRHLLKFRFQDSMEITRTFLFKSIKVNCYKLIYLKNLRVVD